MIISSDVCCHLIGVDFFKREDYVVIYNLETNSLIVSEIILHSKVRRPASSNFFVQESLYIWSRKRINTDVTSKAMILNLVSYMKQN